MINIGRKMQRFLCLLMVSYALSACAVRIPINTSYRTIKGSYRKIVSLFSSKDSVTVKKGDTLYSISRRYQVPLRSIISLNNIPAPYTLYVGQQLRLPGAKVHEVKKGDTLYSISRKYGVDLSQLSKHNNISSPFSLSVGQKLSIPDSIVRGSSYVASSAPASSSSTTKYSSVTSSYYRNKMAAEGKPLGDLKTTSTTKAPVKKYSGQSKVLLPDPAPRSSNKFDWPIKGRVLVPFGDLGKGRHNDGINIQASKGAKVGAAENGVVAYVGNSIKGFGNLILIKHSGGWMSAYAHNDKILVSKGQKVSRGQSIALVGKTGSVISPQVHFELRKGSKAIDPRLHLKSL